MGQGRGKRGSSKTLSCCEVEKDTVSCFLPSISRASVRKWWFVGGLAPQPGGVRPSDSPVLLKPEEGAAGAGSITLHRPCMSDRHPSSAENGIKETLRKQPRRENNVFPIFRETP